MFLGIIKPISGEISIFGQPYKKIYKEIAYIPQSGSVNWNFPTTVFDVVLMGALYPSWGHLKSILKKIKI